MQQLAGIDGKSLKKYGKAAAIASTAVAAVGTVSKVAFQATAKAVEATVAVTKEAVENAGAFQKEMANVSTLLTDSDKLGTVSERMSQLSDDVLEASNKTGVATSDLSDGLYQVISAYGDAADSTKIMELAAKSGAAGMATTTDAVNLLSAVTKAYGDTSFEANQKVSDMAFETVRLGQTTYSELASSIQDVTSLSNAMGVSQEELFGVFAAGTGVVGSAAEVSTKLKAVYTKLMKPTKEMSSAFEAMGYSSGEAMVKNLGLQGTLDAITKYSEKSGTSLSKLYGSSNAAVLATALTGDLSGALTEKTAAMGKAGGATDTAFAKQSGTYEYTMQMLNNLKENALTKIGTALLPHLTKLGTKAMPLITNAVEKILPITEKLFESIDFELISGLAESLLPVVVDAISQILPAVGGLIPVIQQLLPPVVQFASTLISRLLPPLITIIQNLLPVFMPLLEPVMSILLSLMPLITTLLTAVMPLINIIVSGLNRVVAVLNFIMPIISGILSVALSVIGLITNAVSGLAQSIIGLFTNLLEKLTSIVKKFVNMLISGMNWIINKINGFIDKANSFKIPEGVPLIGGAGFNFPHIPVIPQMATGGIVTSATELIAGEGSEPEAIIPLSQLASMLPDKSVTSNNAHSESKVFYITYAPVIHCGSGDPDEIAEAQEEEYEKFKRFLDQYTRDSDRVAL